MEATIGLCTYMAPGVGQRTGLLLDGQVHDAEAILRRDNPTRGGLTMTDLLSDWKATVDAIMRSAPPSRGQGIPVSDVDFDVPVMHSGTIYCAGANYRDHIAEMARATGDANPLNPREQGNIPWHFIRPSRSCLVADKARIERPPGCTKLDWEVELAVVIGETARHVPVQSALDHVAGYAIAVDLSARDLFRRPLVSKTSPFHFDWLAHKGFEGSCPLGPYLTLASAVKDPQGLPIRLSVNGEIKQDSNTSEMIFSVAEQIAHISQLVTLHPGDIILTGTPAGVGSAHGIFLQPGDVLEASIGGLGSLSATIV